MMAEPVKPWLKTSAKGRGKGGKGWGMSYNDMMRMASMMKGWGKGKGGAPPKAIGEDVVVDESARYTGKVSSYQKFNGFGFIELSQEGIVPDNCVHVRWKAIQTEDRFPFLTKDMEVEFGLEKRKVQWSNPTTYTLSAKDVTFPGGAKIAVQDQFDAEKKTFVAGNQNMRYKGTLKFYNSMAGFGYITMDDGYSFDGEEVPKELRVEWHEFNAGQEMPPNLKDCALPVEFGIVKTQRGAYRAYNMTGVGGGSVTQSVVEHREVVAGQTFSGTVELWQGRRGFGYVKTDAALPDNVMAKIAEMKEAIVAKGKSPGDMAEKTLYFRRSDVTFTPGVKLEAGQAVTFTAYVDDKGAGACEVKMA